MIETSFTEVHDETWLATHILDWNHELVVLRQVIPWNKITQALQGYYCQKAGRLAKNLRLTVAALILGKLRKLGDQGVIDLVRENRYAQYFCNVRDETLSFFGAQHLGDLSPKAWPPRDSESRSLDL